MLRSTSKLIITLCALGLSATVLGADKAELLAKIKAQASQYNEFKELLNSPDQSIRVAAFDGMANSGDPALRNVAIDEALANEDVTMQALAFNEVFKELDIINFTISLPEKASEETKKNVSERASAYTLNIKNKDTGTFSGQADGYAVKGSVSGTEISFITSGSRGCQGKASLTDGVILMGVLSCKKMTESAIISAKIR